MNTLFDQVIMPRECLKGNLPTVLPGSEGVDPHTEGNSLNREKFSFGFTLDQRKFVAMQVDIDGEKFFQYFFQHYVNNKYNWENDGQGFIVEGGMNSAQVKLMTDLYEGKTVVLTEEHRPVYRLKGKSVKMC